MKRPVAATNLPASPPPDPDSEGLDARVEASFGFQLNSPAQQQQQQRQRQQRSLPRATPRMVSSPVAPAAAAQWYMPSMPSAPLQGNHPRQAPVPGGLSRRQQHQQEEEDDHELLQQEQPHGSCAQEEAEDELLQHGLQDGVEEEELLQQEHQEQQGKRKRTRGPAQLDIPRSNFRCERPLRAQRTLSNHMPDLRHACDHYAPMICTLLPLLLADDRLMHALQGCFLAHPAMQVGG
jgi:hypothetical protein